MHVASRPRITVAIPARNEAASVGPMLAAFAAQQDLAGYPLASDIFEIVIFANNCTDKTLAGIEQSSREFPALRIHVVDCILSPEHAHIGYARRSALDIAVERQYRYHGSGGIVATTDADSCVDSDWIAQTLVAMQDCDAVAGDVVICEHGLAGMPTLQRKLYLLERRYRTLLGRMVGAFDPRPWDPQPQHDAFVGASFAVRVGTYRAAGGLPILSCLEDFAFAVALRKIDARIRHSSDIRVATSSRSSARVDGGFGTFMRYLAECGEHGSFLVEHGERSIYRALGTAALRKAWSQPYSADRFARAAALYRLPVSTLMDIVDFSRPFGETLDRTDGLSIWFEDLPDQAVETASDTIAAAIEASAMRMSAASGAG